MIIIIEGIDRVGKTTLCEMIENRYRDIVDFRRFRDDTRYSHNYLNREVNTEKINTLQNLLETGFIENIILDRYHITEFVYGGIERSYKNEDMFDIDRRLAELDKKDTLDEEEQEVDPGMMFTGEVHNDVVLIYVVPVDIKTASESHGHNLERHLEWYNDFYRRTLISRKVEVDYNTFDIALEFLDSVIIGDEGNGEPEESEDIEETLSVSEIKESTLESIIKHSSFFSNRAK